MYWKASIGFVWKNIKSRVGHDNKIITSTPAINMIPDTYNTRIEYNTPNTILVYPSIIVINKTCLVPFLTSFFLPSFLNT